MEMGRIGLMLLSLVFMLSMVHAQLQPFQNIAIKELIRREEDKNVNGSLEKLQNELGEKRLKSVIKKGGSRGRSRRRRRSRGGGGSDGAGAGAGGHGGGGAGVRSGGHSNQGSKASEGSSTASPYGGVPLTTVRGKFNQGKSSNEGAEKQKKNGANAQYIDLHLWIFASLTTPYCVFLSA